MIQLESFYEIRKEIDSLTKSNSKEADWMDEPLDVNWDFYKLAEDAGMMFCFTSRDKQIDGYINCTIQPHHHRKNILYCNVDVIYVRPEARKAMLGIKLLKKAEAYAKQIGKGKVVMVFGGQKVDISPLAKRLGYEQSEIIYRKVL